MQRNLTVEALAAHNPKPNMRVALVRLYRVAAAGAANEHIFNIVILGIAFHRCIFSSNRPLAIAAISGSDARDCEHAIESP